MLPSRVSQPWPISVFKSTGRLLEATGLYSVRFEEDAVLESAVRMTGMNDFGNE
jgi:hypothetical protein